MLMGYCINQPVTHLGPPWSLTMFVLVQVSSMKISLSVSLAARRHHWRERLAR